VSATTVAYIVGAGRSGSTLLDLLLGRLDGWFSTGELRHLWHAQRDGYLCGCGAQVVDCPVWSDVLARSRPPAPEAVLADVRSVLRTRQVAGLASPGLLGGSHAEAAGRLRTTLGSVYSATSEVTGARVLVDSSKDPLYGLLLAQVPELQVHAIHLVRDPRAVTRSEQRTRVRPELGDRGALMPVRSARRASLEWNRRNALAQVLAHRSVTSTRVRYEDLVADPDAVVEQITRAVTGAAPVDAAVDAGAPRNHTVGGNPMRFESGKLEIRPDVEWRTGLSARDRRTVVALTWPLLLRYGYRVR
jgi:hypothetical protein